jgi:hypothetical protein
MNDLLRRLGDRGSGNLVARTDGRDQPVAPSRDRLDVARHVGGIAERVAQPLHDGVEPVLEVDVRVGRPEACAQLVARDQAARTLDQCEEDLQRLGRQYLPARDASQLARTWVEHEVAYPNGAIGGTGHFVHGWISWLPWRGLVCSLEHSPAPSPGRIHRRQRRRARPRTSRRTGG